MPSKKVLEACHIANPHGMGFVSESEYYKTMSFAQFRKRLSKVSKDENCIIHFRLATHGSVGRKNCHPFQKNGIFFAHNGILPIAPDGDKTDSETAFLRHLYPVAEAFGIQSDELRYEVQKIIGGSKFAFMRDGNVVTFGAFTNIQGVAYSNTRWLYYL